MINNIGCRTDIVSKINYNIFKFKKYIFKNIILYVILKILKFVRRNCL